MFSTEAALSMVIDIPHLAPTTAFPQRHASSTSGVYRSLSITATGVHNRLRQWDGVVCRTHLLLLEQGQAIWIDVLPDGLQPVEGADVHPAHLRRRSGSASLHGGRAALKPRPRDEWLHTQRTVPQTGRQSSRKHPNSTADPSTVTSGFDCRSGSSPSSVAQSQPLPPQICSRCRRRVPHASSMLRQQMLQIQITLRREISFRAPRL